MHNIVLCSLLPLVSVLRSILCLVGLRLRVHSIVLSPFFTIYFVVFLHSIPLSFDFALVPNKPGSKCYCLDTLYKSIQEDNAACATHALKYCLLPLEMLSITASTTRRH